MNYNIIQDEEKLKEFIDFLPELEKNEIYYVALFARKKYDDILKSDKSQLKRFTATKDRLLSKIKHLEIEEGRYESEEGIIASQKSLALYIMPNPRSLHKASVDLMVSIANDMKTGRVHNPNSEALSALQVNCARKIYCDVDIDLVDKSQIPVVIDEIKTKINEECLTFLESRGGLHVLIKYSKVDKKYSKTWYMDIVHKYADPTRPRKKKKDNDPSDNLIPVPGCTQGSFVPKILK